MVITVLWHNREGAVSGKERYTVLLDKAPVTNGKRERERECGQTLKNDGLLSVWSNDEDCLAYVRDAYFLNR